MAHHFPSLIPRSAPRAILLGATLALAVTVGSCIEMVKRPGPGARTPDWETAAASPGTDSTAARTAPASPATSAPAAAVRADHSHRSRDRVRQVNEYVYWCMERDLWDEARLHLERALSVDSLAASLHNNMGIVHEKQGRPQEAMAEYERARQLRPKDMYGDNLRRLRQLIEAADEPSPDSLRVEYESGNAARVPSNREAEADSAAVDQMQR